MTNLKPVYTHEQIEAARAAKIAEGAEADRTEAPRMVQNIDEAIALLQANRDHIGAFTLVVVAKCDSATVDPSGCTGNNGVVLGKALNEDYARLVHTHLLDLTRM